MKQEKQCEHKSFEAFQSNWLCQWCKEIFSSEEIEQIMVERRKGFDSEIEEGQI